MWIILGVLAIIATFRNLQLYITGRDYKLAMALGLSFTALTLSAEYSLISSWVRLEDWSALQDVVPYMEKVIWILTVVSILLNIAPIILEKIKK